MLLPRVPRCQCPMVSVSQIFATQIATDSPPLSPPDSHTRGLQKLGAAVTRPALVLLLLFSQPSQSYDWVIDWVL